MNARKLLDWRKFLIYTHRWMGIFFGIVFVVPAMAPEHGDFRPPRKAHPGLLVRELSALMRKLREAGVEVVEAEPLPNCAHVYIADPFGNRIELMEPSGNSSRLRQGRKYSTHRPDEQARLNSRVDIPALPSLDSSEMIGRDMNIPQWQGLTLRDEKVVLRPYQLDDIDRLFEAASESIETIYPWLAWCHPNYTLADSEDWVKQCPSKWAAGDTFAFVMLQPGTARFVGACGLNQFRPENKIANLGYWVRRTAMGRGYTPAATRLLARFGFEQLDLHRIEIVMAIGNVPSQRAAEKAGAFREGIQRSRLTIHGKIHDAVIYSFVLEDFGISSARARTQ